MLTLKTSQPYIEPQQFPSKWILRRKVRRAVDPVLPSVTRHALIIGSCLICAQPGYATVRTVLTAIRIEAYSLRTRWGSLDISTSSCGFVIARRADAFGLKAK
jgi:hypothetical protein